MATGSINSSAGADLLPKYYEFFVSHVTISRGRPISHSRGEEEQRVGAEPEVKHEKVARRVLTPSRTGC